MSAFKVLIEIDSTDGREQKVVEYEKIDQVEFELFSGEIIRPIYQQVCMNCGAGDHSTEEC